MSGNYIQNAAVYLIELLYGLYILIVLVRFLLQTARANFYNPISQFVVKATNPLLVPLRRIIPGYGGVDIAALVLLYLLQAIKI
ncbi:YggT family protein, partial [Klebsiella pneumoniae]|uniref:YggT family protein n=1 Tax=Klebsiella pneumoniae TaxID=573 RepID=UPI000D929D7F